MECGKNRDETRKIVRLDVAEEDGGRYPHDVLSSHATPERQSLFESHRQRRWLTRWSYLGLTGVYWAKPPLSRVCHILCRVRLGTVTPFFVGKREDMLR
jgi:hypothetical protein